MFGETLASRRSSSDPPSIHTAPRRAWPRVSAFVPPKGTTNTADWGKNLMTIQEGALAAGETSGNLGMYLGLGVKDDIVEPENEICE